MVNTSTDIGIVNRMWLSRKVYSTGDWFPELEILCISSEQYYNLYNCVIKISTSLN